VFLDPAGRRARAMRAIGLGIGAATAATVALVVTGALGFADVPPISATLHAPHLAVTRTPPEPHGGQRFAILVRRERDGRADARADARADSRLHGRRAS
jgi:hypothetical protein